MQHSSDVPPARRRRIRIGIDTGGTFTDIVALDEDSGEVATTKTPSTPADPAEGFMRGVRKVLALLPGVVPEARGGVVPEARGADVTAISHGTTVATNQLLQDRIGDLGLITTEGFEFILEIARQSVPDGYGNSYFWVKPPRIVPVHRVKTVGGRLDHTGAEVRPFDEAGAVAVARWYRDRGITALGVCFLHSYANPEHELAMRAVLEREHPQAVVSLSHEVLREYREYERSMTTLVDAAVKPTITRYIAHIAAKLAALETGDPSHTESHTEGAARTSRSARNGIPFYVMKSNGGVLSAEEVVHQPITTVLSGPAAGALGAALVARTATREPQGDHEHGQGSGLPSVLTLDGGGTSTDVAVVLDGEPSLTTEGSVGRYPSKIPMIDIVTVGAGGGSLAWITPEGTLKVGPASAGADPGPLCYGRGGAVPPGRTSGAAPTVTDAHAYLGRIPPRLLGGEIPLDVSAARAGLTKLADDLGLEPERCASGVLEISTWNQANAIRQITVKRGLDVRDYPMVTFGGSGPLLACRLIDVLDLPAAVIPENPGNLSAFGLLTVDVKNDYVQTAIARDADLELGTAAGVYAELERRAAAALAREGFPPDRRRFVRSADLRYYGQAFEVRVPAPGGPVDETFRAEVVRGFHDAHERLYGYCYRDDDARHAVEWVNLRVSGIGPITRPRLRERSTGDGDPERGRTGTREVFYDDWIPTPIYQRERLEPGDVVHGPAVIEEFGSTLPVHPGFHAAVDTYGNVIVTRERN